MQSKYGILHHRDQEAEPTSQELAQRLETFLSPLLLVLDRLLDKRLVRTLVQCCVAIIRFRKNKQGLLLSELGSYMDGYRGVSKKATAGTKRVSNLLRSLKWSALQIDHFLLTEANKEVERLRTQGKRILCLFDGSVIEKPESGVVEGLGPVLSSKAKRTNRCRKGLLCNHPPIRPSRVMGMQWPGTLIAALDRLPRIAVMKWWTRKGEYAHQLREVEESVLRTCVRTWGQMLTYVFDRGDACGPWLEVLEKFRVKFIIRWIKKHLFYDQEGKEKKLWEIGRGKRYLAQKVIPDTTSGLQVARDLWWTPLRHPQYSQQLYLVKVRVKGKVWYLITHERVQTEEQAWEIFFACKRRWQIETSFRYGKCELAMQSPRLWLFENRLKLLGIVLLVYAFLLYLLEDVYKELVESLLRWRCHRTGKRCREALVPLSRLRWALSRLWDDSRPLLGSLLPPDWETLQALAPFQR